MNDWYAATCEKLKLLYDILDREVFSRDYIQVDESTLPVIDNEKHRAVKGYMWCVRAVEGNLVVFHYDMGSRSHETARKLLRGYRGTIQTDGYGAYDQFESDPHIQVIGCWAHARRKWSDALDEDKRTASEALAYINKLYHVENEAKEAGISGEALKEKRQKESYPVILQFEKWMYETVTKTSRNSRIGKAISYTLPLLPRLSRYVNDGCFCIDNTLVENAIRSLAWEGRTTCSAGTTMLRCVLPSSTPWWTVARPWTLIHVNGWRMSCSGYPGTRTTVKLSVNSCQTSGQNRPTRINLTQLWPT